MKAYLRLTALFFCILNCSLNLHSQTYETPADSLRHLIATTSVDTSRAMYMAELGWILRKDSPEVAIKVLEKAIEWAPNHAPSASMAYNALGVVYRKRNRPYDARQHLRIAIELRRSSGDSLGVANTCTNLGKVHNQIGEPETAIQYYERAANIYHTLNDGKRLARAYNQLGSVFRSVERFKLSYNSLSQSLQIRRVLGDTVEIGRSLLNLANLLVDMEEYPKAIDYLKQATVCFEHKNRRADLAKAWTGLGAAYLKSKNIDLALKYSKDAADQKSLLGDSLGLAGSWINLGLIHEQIGNLRQAEVLFQKALKISTHHFHPSTQLEALTNLGRVLANTGRIQEADSTLSSALRLAKSSNSITSQIDILHSLSYLSHGQSDHERAFDYLNQSDKYRTQLENKLRISKEIKYYYEKLARENEILQSQLEDQKREVEHLETLQNWQLGAILTLFLLFLSAFISGKLLYRKKLDKQATERRIDHLVMKSELEAKYSRIQGQMAFKDTIAQTLHHKIGSSVALLKIQLEVVEDQMKDLLPPGLPNSLGPALNTVNQIAFDAREIAHQNSQKAGMISEIKEFANQISHSGYVQVNVFPKNESEFEQLRPGIEREISLAVREIITNALKYAKASTIEIQFLRVNGSLHLSVSDDGIGFDPNAKSTVKGMGLRSIKGRVKSLNGTFELDSSPGNGTTIFIEVPIKTKDE